MHYDLEVSSFPSSHNGHPVLLNLKEQTYPGATVIEDWPSWNLPIFKWAKSQGAVAGYAHTSPGLQVRSMDLPNYELPKFDDIGANEYIVDVTHGVVDFISAIDTVPTWELNIWYHTLNTGFRTRVAGETDFPCIYGERVGMGRSYVQLEQTLNYEAWVGGLASGRSYVSDGKSHLLDFRVNQQHLGVGDSELRLDAPGTVRVTARVAARLGAKPNPDIRNLPRDHPPFWDIERARIGETNTVPVEVVVNGRPVAAQQIAADGTLRDIAFEVPLDRSSWIALRILPSSHTNPIFVLIGGQPIRASRKSAEWCLAGVDQCWRQKMSRIREIEQPDAAVAYEHARQVYRQRIAESDRD
jgi:hypothetical protein